MKRETAKAITLDEMEQQIAIVMEAVKRRPAMRNRILKRFLSNIVVAAKETLKKRGRVAPFYMIVAEAADFGVPPLTEDVIAKAKESKAQAIVTIEGFHSDQDISDVIYHITMSAPSIGVLGLGSESENRGPKTGVCSRMALFSRRQGKSEDTR